MQVFLISAVLIASWIVWTILALSRNYRAAKGTGLPIVIIPVSPLNPFWLLITKLLLPSITKILQRLPVGSWPRYTYLGWQFDDKYRAHRELGSAFVLCTPAYNEVVVADPAVVHHVFTKRKDFVKPAMMYDGLNVFGKNLDTVEGEVWQRHRKITAPNFNEKVSGSVWSESVRQSKQMLEEWTRASGDGKGTRHVVDDTASLALNVLAFAGFGQSYDFNKSATRINPPHKLSYRDALYCVLRNFTLLVIFPASLLKLSVLPAKIRAVGQAYDEFKLYMKELVDRERNLLTSGEQSDDNSHNLLKVLVKASQTEKEGLTDEELYGNIFIYNMAGHETTANTIATSIAYLALEPEWQDWLSEEIATVSAGDGRDREYEATFPRLKRCQAVMLETLRLHGSVIFITKITSSTQVLKVSGKEHILPPSTFVTVNSQAVHCDTESWGSDALRWRPDRWITNTNSLDITKETLIETRPGSFVAWAGGPRVCPGQKFSQVEFVGVMTTLFAGHRVRPVLRHGDDDTTARTRLANMIEDSAITAITLQMKRPEDVSFLWEAR